MAAILSCSALTKAFTSEPIFSGLDIAIDDRERLGVIGPNGSGKSTLLRIMARLEAPDQGTVALRRGAQCELVLQQTAFRAEETPLSLISSAARRRASPEHELDKRIQLALNRGGFTDPEKPLRTLSGGWQKRAALAAALAAAPDILLLDEPTNHLDLEGTLWLEEILTNAPFAWILVTHDRYFLERTAQRIFEVNRLYSQGFLLVDGSYSDYLEQKAAYLDAQTRYQSALANKVRRETEWLRRGPKARRTKAKGRIQQAHELISELGDLRGRLRDSGTTIDFQDSERKTRKLIEVKGAAKEFDDRAIFNNLDMILSPGFRIGVLGLNGSGKTTLLKLLAKQLRPDRGSVIQAPELQLTYFEQSRGELNPDWTLKRALAESGDAVVFQGQSVHVSAWAKRFQFRPNQLDLQVSQLSGGEKARLLIARLMLKPADVLLLDEPTNDLDIPALEALEESLLEFNGAAVIVSHDRYLLSRICQRFIGFTGSAEAAWYADYEQWESALQISCANRAKKEKEPAPGNRSAAPVPQRKKLGYLEQREYDGIEAAIAVAERRLQESEEQLQNPAGSAADLAAAASAWEQARAEVDRLYARWEELEAKLAPG